MTTLEIEDCGGELLTVQHRDEAGGLLMFTSTLGGKSSAVTVELMPDDATHLHAYLTTWLMRQNMERARRTMEEEEEEE